MSKPKFIFFFLSINNKVLEDPFSFIRVGKEGFDIEDFAEGEEVRICLSHTRVGPFFSVYKVLKRNFVRDKNGVLVLLVLVGEGQKSN